jgi:hypothetical protein
MARIEWHGLDGRGMVGRGIGAGEFGQGNWGRDKEAREAGKLWRVDVPCLCLVRTSAFIVALRSKL